VRQQRVGVNRIGIFSVTGEQEQAVAIEACG
jgi:hypothetical protein